MLQVFVAAKRSFAYLVQIHIVHYFPVDVITFEELTSEANVNIEEYVKALPNLKEREELEKCEDEKYVRTKVRNFAIGFIPPSVRHILRPKMLSWIEESVFDKEKHFFEWNIIPHFFKDIFQCKGSMAYINEGESRMKREIKGFIRVSVPIFGTAIEQIIVKHLKENFEKEYVFTKKIINKQLQSKEAKNKI